ncbi:unnamed protein product, partial [Arabidopsis halleri]
KPLSTQRSQERNISSGRRSPTRSHTPYRGYHNSDLRHHLHSKANSKGQSAQNYQWREKAHTQGTGLLESSVSSRTRRPPLERDLSPGRQSSPGFNALNPPAVSRPLNSGMVTPIPPPPPVPVLEDVMGELREVTVQYTSCADPTESAARRQRVLQGEARGL